MRILIDQDGTIYDLYAPWYALHNKDYGHIHTMTRNNVDSWDTASICKKHNCPADIYGYLSESSVWSDGLPLADSIRVTRQLMQNGHDLGILTTVAKNAIFAMPIKHRWLKNHFPHIENVIMVDNHVKHWVHADVLIDDGLHNLQHFTGISVVYDQPWNRSDAILPRARNWNHVERIVSRADYLIRRQRSLHSEYVSYGEVQLILADEINAGKL